MRTSPRLPDDNDTFAAIPSACWFFVFCVLVGAAAVWAEAAIFGGSAAPTDVRRVLRGPRVRVRAERVVALAEGCRSTRLQGDVRQSQRNRLGRLRGRQRSR
jgi:hypothetical protein